jgi:hypothetical protein
VKDSQSNLVQGRTRWRRFAALMVPTTAVAGAIVIGMTNGAIAASFAVSGQTFKVSASKLVGTSFAQYGGVASENGADENNPLDPKNHPVVVSAIADADLYDLCQSVKVPDRLTPVPIILKINAGGGGTPASAHNLLIDMDSLKGNATFTNIEIGRDAADLGAPEKFAGTFGQSADEVVITDLKQVARATSAGTFSLTGLSLGLEVGPQATECFE